MKTIKQHLKTLKQPYKDQAIKNTSNKLLKKECLDIELALLKAFIWATSPEESEYWEKVFESLSEHVENQSVGEDN